MNDQEALGLAAVIGRLMVSIKQLEAALAERDSRIADLERQIAHKPPEE